MAFKKRYSNKYQLNAHYTLAKSQAWFGASADFGLQPQNLFVNLIQSTLDQPAKTSAIASCSPVSSICRGTSRSRRSSSWRRSSLQHLPVLLCDINRDGVNNDRESVNPGIDDQHKLPLNSERGDKFLTVERSCFEVLQVGRELKLGLFFEAFNVFNTGNFGNQFQNVTGEPDFGKPINFFGATGFSEPLGIPFQAS